jgi:hypothetical protein
LIWYFRTEEYGLPYTGGWMEQPAGLLDRIRLIGKIYYAVTSRRQADPVKLADWKRNHPDYNRIIRYLRELGCYAY